MFNTQNLVYLILLPSVFMIPQINLYDTDWINARENDNDITLEHTCLHVNHENSMPNWDLGSYCMSELPSRFKIENYQYFSKWTFHELVQKNITSEHLYLWSAPIDLIERYQFYLNQLSTVTNDLLLGKQIFYNCTMPRFGPLCQYQLAFHHSHQSSLSEIIDNYYSNVVHHSQSDWTCYIHLQCNQHLYPSCLDWTEICDGKIDCLNNGVDEEHCWKLEVNQCNDNEYRCKNGQCIPYSFFDDVPNRYDCIDASDEPAMFGIKDEAACSIVKPSFVCDDMKCNNTMHLSSSCIPSRKNLLKQRMFSIQNGSLFKHCWSALKCLFNIQDDGSHSFCENLCMNNECKNIILNTCPDMLYFPNVPIFFDDVYLVFKKIDSQEATMENIGLLYICYNHSLYDSFFNMTSKIVFNNTTCFLDEKISYPWRWSTLWDTARDTSLRQLNNDLRKYRLPFHYTPIMCNRSNMYQCMNSSKCISIYRLMDNFYDCPYMDDETMFDMNNNIIIKQFKYSHYKCQLSDKYIHKLMIRNYYCDCGFLESRWCEDESWLEFEVRKSISFQTTCDGYVELFPIIINGRNETDETECEQWECDNIYTHCDGFWNCLNGADEVNCNTQIAFNCSSNYHRCISPHTNELMCLPIDQANDGKVDCLGATDEPLLCRTQSIFESDAYKFYCTNQLSESCVQLLELCDGKEICEGGDDEQFCTSNLTVHFHGAFCSLAYHQGSDVEKFLCKSVYLPKKTHTKLFSLSKSNTIVNYEVNENTESLPIPSLSLTQVSNQFHSRCHHGLDLTVWLNNKNNSTATTCLCSPSYYGDRCQYQNQRISLTVQFRALSDSRKTFFVIILSLIDNSEQRIIHSYKQISYLPIQHCNIKFDMYLLYSKRPKDTTKDYAIHLDIYEKQSLIHRGSLLYPVIFPFLPVQHLALIINIPPSYSRDLSCSDKQCLHGECIRYSNNLQSTSSFCRCHEGWSGQYCNISHNCICASDSLCIGIAANNQPICVCSLNKFGPRCLLSDTTCQNQNNSFCKNGGQCIFNVNYRMFEEKFTCICPDGFNGARCENIDYKLVLSFNENIVLSQSILIHLIASISPFPLIRYTTFQTIRIRQNSVIIHWSDPFQLAFIELSDQTYYLVLAREIVFPSPTIINNTVTRSDRCPNITELFNQTFLQWPLIRRIKYYHLPCQNHQLNLSCFHDDVHLCLCQNFNQKRLANCFQFDHHMKFDCEGQNECENDGQCFQDKPRCPTTSVCKCRPCYYGRRCQFSTSGFGLSLDAIIGYHILPNIVVYHQPAIIQFSFAFTIIFMIAGLIDGILGIITFKNKLIRNVGCGLYLLSSSIITICIMIMFSLKFLILLLAQMETISNGLFLKIQCISFDFILRICLNMDQWLHACVATERAITTIKATSFDKKKSKRAAKYVIGILLLIIIATSIQDPIYRRLIEEIDDMNEKRIWCTIIYSSGLQTFNSVIHTIHFFGPFILNFISSVILITKKTRQQLSLHQDRTYKEVFLEQFSQHKHLLVGPIVLVILALPRLIITYISKCMKSPSDAWLYLIGYLISFIPCMLTFIIFILPSKFYKKQFRKSIFGWQGPIQRRPYRIRPN